MMVVSRQSVALILVWNTHGVAHKHLIPERHPERSIWLRQCILHLTPDRWHLDAHITLQGEHTVLSISDGWCGRKVNMGFGVVSCTCRSDGAGDTGGKRGIPVRSLLSFTSGMNRWHSTDLFFNDG